MTETEARQVLLLQSREATSAGPHWSTEDRRWATRQAIAAVGSDAEPERFIVARAAVALQRLLPRDASARRWLERRGWHPAWAVLAAVVGLAAGLAADQLGPPQRVNLLAPAVWAVVAWNFAVYLVSMLTAVWPVQGLRPALARFGRGGDSDAGSLWLQHAGPLLSDRVAVVLHTAAAALAAGLVAGLYLRGLVLDYRAGWQSTFLAATQVQALLGTLLAPASALTGIAIPDVVPLRVAPGTDAQATAAPWIHLYAATLAVAVIVPRLLLALRAALAAGHRARRFRLPLQTPYFESLHPLMRPGLPRAVRVLWVNELPPVDVLGLRLGRLEAPVTVLASDEGDELSLLPVPAGVDGAPAPAPVAGGGWWSRWSAPRPASASASAVERLRGGVDAVLLFTAPGRPRPAWLALLGRPVVVVVDAPAVEAPLLSLQALADGWVTDGRLLQALQSVLEGDARMARLVVAWVARRQQHLDAEVAELAATLARVATTHVPAPEAGLLQLRRAGADNDAARQALVEGLDAELRTHAARLQMLLGGRVGGVTSEGLPTDSVAMAGADHETAERKAPGLSGASANSDTSGIGFSKGTNDGSGTSGQIGNSARSTGIRSGHGGHSDDMGHRTSGAGGMGTRGGSSVDDSIPGYPGNAGHPGRTDVDGGSLVPAPASVPARQALLADDGLTQGVPAAAAALHARVGEGRAALVGGVLSGALAGFKADVLSGGLTMGVGAVAGGVLGAIGAAGAARGLNVVRGSDRSYLAWNEEALRPVTQALLVRHLVVLHGLPLVAARERAALVLADGPPALETLWRARQRRFENTDEAGPLAASLQPLLSDVLKDALGRPAEPADAAAAPV